MGKKPYVTAENEKRWREGGKARRGSNGASSSASASTKNTTPQKRNYNPQKKNPLTQNTPMNTLQKSTPRMQKKNNGAVMAKSNKTFSQKVTQKQTKKNRQLNKINDLSAQNVRKQAQKQDKADVSRAKKVLANKNSDQREKEKARQTIQQKSVSSADRKLSATAQAEIRQQKQEYEAAKKRGDKQGMKNAHWSAEYARSYGGYSGGVAGDRKEDFILTGEDKKLNAEGQLGVKTGKAWYKLGMKDEGKNYADSFREDPTFQDAETRNRNWNKNLDLKYEQDKKSGKLKANARTDAHGRTIPEGTYRDKARASAASEAAWKGTIGSLLSFRETANQSLHNYQKKRFGGYGEKLVGEKQAIDRATEGMSEKDKAQVIKSGEWADTMSKLKQWQDTGGNLPVDQNLPGQRLLRESRERATQADELTNSKIGKLGTQAYISTLQMAPGLAVAPFSGGASLAVMGAQAAGSKMGELNEQGVAPSQALQRGLLSGAIEGVTEKIPIGNLLKVAKSAGGKSILKNLAKQAGLEGSEESVSYILNYAADKAAQDPNATFSLKELADNAAVGALSGGAMGGGAAVMGNVNSATVPGEARNNPILNTVNWARDYLASRRETAQTAQETPAEVVAPEPERVETPTQAETTPTQNVAPRNNPILQTVQQAQKVSEPVEKAVETPTQEDNSFEARANRFNQRNDAFKADIKRWKEDPGFRTEENKARLTEENEFIRKEHAALTEEQRKENGEVSKKDIHVAKRTAKDLSNRNLKAFQFDHPEMKWFYAKANAYLVNEVGKAMESQHAKKGEGTRYRASGPVLSAIRKYGLTKPEILKALQNLSFDDGAENNAASKKIERVLDDMLVNGWTDFDGNFHQPDMEYLKARNAIPGANDFEEFKSKHQLSLDLGEVTEDELRQEYEAQNYHDLDENVPLPGKGQKIRKGHFDDGIKVYRGQNHNGDAQVKNLKRVRDIFDFIPNAETKESELIPLSYYTENAEDASNYSSYDDNLYNMFYENAIRDYRRKIMDGKNIGEPEQIFAEKAAKESFRTLTGNEYSGGLGHVDEYTLYPEKILDLSNLGETANLWEIYNLLSKETGISESELDDILMLGDTVFADGDKLPVYALMKNGKKSNLGTTFFNFAKGLGVDDIKYLEDNSVHHAMLGDSASENTSEEMPLPEGHGAMSAGGAGEFASWQAVTPGEQFHPINEKAAAVTMENRGRSYVEVPKVNMQGRLTSKAVSTLMNANITPNEFEQIMEEELAKGNFSRMAYSDDAAANRATQDIVSKGFQRAKEDWLSEIRAGKMSKDLTTTGIILYNNAVNAGDAVGALDIAAEMVNYGKSVGQSLQAFNLINKMTPAGQLYFISRTVENIDENVKSKAKKDPETGLPDVGDIEIDPELAKQFLEAETDEERRQIKEEIYRDVASKIPASWKDKFNAWRYLAMLGNPRTHVRNIVGNLGFMPIRMAKNAVAAGMEGVASRTVGMQNRTKATLNILSREDQARWKAGNIDFDNVVDTIKGSAKYNDDWQQIDEYRQIYRFKPLEMVRKFNGWALDAEDMLFCKPAYSESLAQYLKANNITAEQFLNDEISPEVKNRAREYAVLEAQKATYRDSNQFSEFVSSWSKLRNSQKSGIRGIGYFVEGVMPFKKTPTNIAVRAVEYSPIGLTIGIKQAVVDVKAGTRTASEAVDMMASGLTGTALMGLGYFLAHQGLITGSGAGDDKQKDFDKLQGWQAYALNIGDKNYTLDWLAPEALPVFTGVELFNAFLNRGEGGAALLTQGLEAIQRISDPMLEMSMLQSLNDMIENVRYSENSLGAVVSNTLTSYLGQFLPTLFGQLERTMEDKRYSTWYDRDSAVPKSIQKLLGNWANKIPGVEYNQIPYVDAWGRQQSTGDNPAIRAIKNFLSPGYVSDYNTTTVDTELQRLYDAGFTDGILPTRIQSSQQLDGKYLTGDQYVKWQTTRGQTAFKELSALIGSDGYKAMSDADKADAVKKIYDYAAAKGKVAAGGNADTVFSGWMKKAETAQNDAGISFGEYASLEAKKNQIAKEAEGKGYDKGTQQGLWEDYVAGLGNYSEEQKKYIGENIKVWTQKPADGTAYHKAIASGYTIDDMSKLKELKQAADVDGNGSKSTAELYAAILGSSNDPAEQEKMWNAWKASDETKSWADMKSRYGNATTGSVQKAEKLTADQKANKSAYDYNGDGKWNWQEKVKAIQKISDDPAEQEAIWNQMKGNNKRSWAQAKKGAG